MIKASAGNCAVLPQIVFTIFKKPRFFSSHLTRKTKTRGKSRLAERAGGLTFFHFSPVCKSVQVVCKERSEAHGNRDVFCVLNARQNPQNNQHDIVRRVSERKKRASPEREINREEACRHGNRAWDNIRGIERAQNEVKSHGNSRRQYPHKNNFPRAD